MAKKLIIIFFLQIAVTACICYWFISFIRIDPPVISNMEIVKKERTKVGVDTYKIDKNWIRKNRVGLWEMYVEGDGFERGAIIGKLSKDLIYKQEKAFVDQIKKLIPSQNYLSFLKYFIGFFNRNIDNSVPKEYLQEIYGISLSASPEFDFISGSYQRMLNYHAAHDIGHMLQNYNLVGCTSFAAWGNKTEDSCLIAGRNFDFYVGDEFAEDKIVAFYNPDKGYKFMMVTWGGMTGVVSGMNEKGLTVTINAAKSKIPIQAATPISLIAREVLQYAENIDEAFQIVKKRNSFVSESFLICSAKDKMAAAIEKTPFETVLYKSDKNYLITTNHFQSEKFKNDKMNSDNIENSSSMYRFLRTEQLIQKYPQLTENNVCNILRDQKGLNDKNIGMGNEKSVNQLIAHHSIIFKPEELKVWVSSNPYQLGEYVCYDLNKIFSNTFRFENSEICEKELNLQTDSFLLTENFKNYIIYRELKEEVKKFIDNKDFDKIADGFVNELIKSNSYYFYVYDLAGDYYFAQKKYYKALLLYKISLNHEVTSKSERDIIEKKVNACISEVE
jgi:hypothetical protein